MTLVRDPLFWKRFSRAVHLDEEAKAAAQNKSPGRITNEPRDNWIQAQYRKKRRSIVCGFVIFLAIASLVAGIIVVLLWLHAHDWLQDNRDKGSTG
ncbi:conserved hypothetical protein [Aspergillus fumigatus A1163]|uniref:Uncharacterized protein n=1 Tax=Aspergillus fumigatus (strain CBS 144.89 / FGSC A1163 / CEA10) TaxID=451804 RepID=B0YBY6_ASPFC|nr:conserved hypothetical protein [Aspergillus fumigatus A1163]